MGAKVIITTEKIIITTDLELKAYIADAVNAAFRCYQPPSPEPSQLSSHSKKIDFPTVMKKYYPGIPESTVRQLTAHLSRTKAGRRILLDEDEVEQDQEEKRQKSVQGLSEEIDNQFAIRHQRKGGRKAT